MVLAMKTLKWQRHQIKQEHGLNLMLTNYGNVPAFNKARQTWNEPWDTFNSVQKSSRNFKLRGDIHAICDACSLCKQMFARSWRWIYRDIDSAGHIKSDSFAFAGICGMKVTYFTVPIIEAEWWLIKATLLKCTGFRARACHHCIELVRCALIFVMVEPSIIGKFDGLPSTDDVMLNSNHFASLFKFL